jgi:bidirectional [NiFe] hydrogenase diaphorase subunit
MITEELERIREAEQEAGETPCARVCIAASCLSSRSDAVKDALGKTCKTKGVGCMGLCSAGPLVAVGDTLYRDVTPENVERMTPCDTGHPFFERQTRIVLENSGLIDPERIEEYIGRDGYLALADVLAELQPTEVIDAIVRSGLRGRGGAGYPTGLKWSTVAKARAAQKYVICNADEGDPGAFMDRSVLESDPHRVLEGMAIAAYATGATRGYMYVRGEYPLAVKRLKTAIRQAERLGVLGNSVCGTTFSFHVEIRLGAGAFVCGEETALIASIEGNRGQPRPRPPYPAQRGVFGCPTLINNVETFANIPAIMRKGADWYASIGTEKSKGTKVFALAGAIERSGLIEVPMGMTLREIIFEIGGGCPGGRAFKAVQTGGPSGGCIPALHLDKPVDYESLLALGSIMGSGGMIVMDETSNMVDVARFFMEFCMSESCGKCVPCRVGTAQMHDLLERFSARSATQRDLAMLEDLCQMVRETSLCGLGQSAPNPVISTMRYFPEEYREAIRS